MELFNKVHKIIVFYYLKKQILVFQANKSLGRVQCLHKTLFSKHNSNLVYSR